MHARGVTLKHEDPVVQICDQAWEAISFSMHKPASILILKLKQAEVSPDSHSFSNSIVPPRVARVERERKQGHCSTS